MKSSIPAFTRTGPVKTNSILSCDKKTLRTILEIIYLQGCVSEIQIFELFVNRRDAITFIERGTTGRNRLLDSRLDRGIRYYYFSEHFLQKQAAMEASQ